MTSFASSVREKLKNVARAALEDRSNVVQTGVLGVIVRTILFPYRKYGLLALLIAPFYIVLVLPLCILLFAVYCIPTIYLTHRLPFHARKLIGINSIPANEKRMKFKRMRKLGRRISKVSMCTVLCCFSLLQEYNMYCHFTTLINFVDST